MVGRVGEDLRLEAAAGVGGVVASSEAGDRNRHHVAVVELDPGLGRGDVEGEAVLRRVPVGPHLQRMCHLSCHRKDRSDSKPDICAQGDQQQRENDVAKG